MSLAQLVSFADDGPWCGTRPPGPHPPLPRQQHSLLLTGVGDEVPLSPQPLPPGGEIAALLFQAIRLHQYGHALSSAKVDGEVADVVFQASSRIFDDGQCGSVPWSIVLQWLQRPPPPPPPWVEVIGHAVSHALIGARIGGEFGEQLQAGASALIRDQLGVSRPD